MANTVVGIFEFEDDAQQAQNYLLANGFADGDVDIKTASYKSESGEETIDRDDDDSKDGIGNFFRNLFDGDEDETKRYSEAGKRGTIVTVHAKDADEAEAAAAILDQFGAIDVADDNTTGYSTADQAYIAPVSSVSDESFTSVTDESFTSVTDESFTSEDQATSLPIIEEELHVGKREVETGGVRLRSRIIERQVQESIRLRQEIVTINRTPVDRIASERDFDTFKEGTIEMKEYAEVPVVSKEARVIQEVSLSKTVDERDEIINETLRSTEVDVEDLTDEERLRSSDLDS